MGGIQKALVAGVGVGGGHCALDNAKLLVQHLDKGGQAVGGAGSVAGETRGAGG